MLFFCYDIATGELTWRTEAQNSKRLTCQPVQLSQELPEGFEELVEISLQIDCEGEIEAEEPKFEDVRIMIG